MRIVTRNVRVVAAFIVLAFAVSGLSVAADFKGNLVDVAWLEKHRGDTDLVVLDASLGQAYAAGHIPGSVSVDVFSYGAQETPVAEMERRIQSWGVSPGKRIVLYDGGGSNLATRLFFTLAYYGFPVKNVAILDGGLSKWKEAGLPVTQEPGKAEQGSFRIGALHEDLRVRLPEFLTASGDTANYALVEALTPEWHYGQIAPFDKPGHIPNSVLLPGADFYNADKTFKSPDEIRKMLAFLDVGPEKHVYSYCGGGVAASVPFFALKYLLGYTKVELFIESELGWLKDERQLPFWTYDAPSLMRETGWLQAWNGKMLRMYGVAQISVIDVRPKEAYDQGHVPFALNVPATVFASNVANPARLAEALSAAGVDPSHEAVIISGGGLTREAALAFMALETLGQRKVSLFIDSMELAAQRGVALTKEPTLVGARKGPGDISIVPTAYPVRIPKGVAVADPKSAKGIYPKVFIASGSTVPASAPQGTVVHVPWTTLLDADGTPKAAKEIWSILSKAGVPRYAELVCIADDPGDAAANYFILRLMGYPEARVLTASAPDVAALR